LISVTDPLYNVTSYQYDAVGNITKVTDGDGGNHYSTYTYNLLSQLVSSSDPLGNVTHINIIPEASYLRRTTLIMGQR